MRPNYLPLPLKTFVATVTLLFVGNLYAANWYVRPSSTGSNTGTDWNNAWSLSSINWSSISPGDTIWLAGGSYGSTGLSVGANGAANRPILIYRVLSTDAVPVSAPGWSSSFDSTVDLGTGGIYLPNNAYVTIDGRVPYTLTQSNGGTSEGLRNAGMTITVSGNGGAGISGPAGGSGIGLDHITLSNISITGPYNNSGSSAGSDIDGINFAGPTQSGPVTNLLIHGVSIRGTGNALRGYQWNGVVIEYCYIADTTDTNTQHGDLQYSYSSTNVTMRYNYFNNSFPQGVYFQDSGMVNFYFYGNVFYNSDNLLMCPSGTVGPFGPFYYYNNIFGGNAGSDSMTSFDPNATFVPTCYVYNNIYWNCTNQAHNAKGGVVSDYNAYNYTSYNGYPPPLSQEPHSFTFTGSPFVNYPPYIQQLPNKSMAFGSIGDFHWASGTAAAAFQKGLANPPNPAADPLIAKDMDGNARASGGLWYIGPYQYAASGGGPAAPTNLHVVPTQ